MAGIVKSSNSNPHSGWLEAVPKGAGEACPSLSVCFPHPQTPFLGGRGSRTDPSLPPPSAPHSPAHGPSSDSAPTAFHPSCLPNQSGSKFVPPGHGRLVISSPALPPILEENPGSLPPSCTQDGWGAEARLALSTSSPGCSSSCERWAASSARLLRASLPLLQVCPPQPVSLRRPLNL